MNPKHTPSKIRMKHLVGKLLGVNIEDFMTCLIADQDLNEIEATPDSLLTEDLSVYCFEPKADYFFIESISDLTGVLQGQIWHNVLFHWFDNDLSPLKFFADHLDRSASSVWVVRAFLGTSEDLQKPMGEAMVSELGLLAIINVYGTSVQKRPIVFVDNFLSSKEIMLPITDMVFAQRQADVFANMMPWVLRHIDAISTE